MEIRKKIIKKIGSIVIAFSVAIISLCLPFLYKINPKNMIASADIYYNPFYMNYNCPIVYQTFVTTNVSSRVQSSKNFRVELSSSSSYDMYGETYFSLILFDAGYSYSVSREYDSLVCETDGQMQYLDILNFDNENGNYACAYMVFNSDGWYCVPFLYYISADWRGDVAESGTKAIYGVKSDKFGSFPKTSSFFMSYDNYSTFFYKIVLSNNSYLEILMPVPVNSAVYQTTSVVGGFSFSGSYQDGYNAGKSQGESSGYLNGYNAGVTVGYNNGYNAGTNATGNYTFFNLVSAVIDAPIQTFMGLFNFELLGINLAGFFTGLLTVAFIVTIVKMIL